MLHFRDISFMHEGVKFTIYVSMKGSLTSVNENKTLSLHNVFVWLCSTYIGHEAKHSCLQEEKVTHLKWYPSLKLLNVPHLLYWGCNKTAMR